MENSSVLRYDDIRVGAVYEFTRIISAQDGKKFAELSGNFNPLHYDSEFGKKSQFKDIIVYGMLAGSLFSTLIGMHCPGRDSLCLHQTLIYRYPIFYGDEVMVRGTVLSKSDSIRVITLKTEILREGNVVLDGEAKVQVL